MLLNIKWRCNRKKQLSRRFKEKLVGIIKKKDLELMEQNEWKVM